MPTLIVTLPTSLPTAATPCCTVLTEDGRTILQQSVAPLSTWPELAGAEIVAVVPATQLSWHRLDLPKGTLDRGFFQDGSPSRLRSVIDGLIEDRLLDEPAQLHFAVEPNAQAGAPTWVAACNRAWLNAWMQTLELAGKAVARIVPELEPAAADAAMPAALYVIGTPEEAQVLWSNSTGVSVLPLASASVALVTDSATDARPPEVVAEPAVAALAEEFFGGRVVLQTSAQRALNSARSAWDLAQFELLRSRRARTRKRLSDWGNSLLHAPQWKPARWATVALIVVNLAGLQAWAWREESTLAAKRQAIRDVLTATFPDVRVVMDAPLQMQRSLDSLQRRSGAASSADLEEMLGRLQVVAPEISSPSAIEFIAGELRLKLATTNGLDVAGINARMQAYGYELETRDDGLVLKQGRRP